VDGPEEPVASSEGFDAVAKGFGFALAKGEGAVLFKKGFVVTNAF